MNATTTTNSSTSSSNTTTTTMPAYNPTQCLFCPHLSLPTLQSTLTHMHTTHSFSIPFPSHLLVDEETLLAYLHLIITQDHQCLSCGTEYVSAEAARQHMIRMGHCAIDVESEGSEFRDFYDLDSDLGDEDESENDAEEREERRYGSQDEDEDGSDEARQDTKQGSHDRATGFVQPDSQSLRMPSGKVIAHRSARPSRYHRPQRPNANQDTIPESVSPNPYPDQNTNSPSAHNQPSTKISRTTRHLTQLSSLRASDRQMLAHLPASQQRALLLNQGKQMARAAKQERNMRGRVERKGNKTLMKHFVPDCPGGRTNG